MNVRRLALIAAVIASVAITAAATSPPDEGSPELQLRPQRVALDQQMWVIGTGWPARSIVLVEVCGNNALDATADCALRSSRSVGTNSDGYFGVQLGVPRPPYACPCVVRVLGDGALEVRAPLVIVDMPTEEPRSRVQPLVVVPALEIAGLEVRGDRSWVEWFGAPVERTVVFEVVNTGTVAIVNPAVSTTWGRGRTPTRIAPTPQIARIEPGETVNFEIPVRLETLSVGSHTVRVNVAGVGVAVTEQASISTIPWGLIVVGLLILQAVLLLIRNRVRRRVEASQAKATPEVDEASEVDEAPEVDEASEVNEASGEASDATDDPLETRGEQPVQILEEEVQHDQERQRADSPAGPPPSAATPYE